MQKYLYILLISFLGNQVSAQIRANRDLLGKWQGENMQVEFFSDQHVMLTLPGGKLPMATFTADFMRNPAMLIITLSNNGQKIIYKADLLFIDNENIQLEYFSGGDENLFEKGRVVKLKKMK